MEPGEQLKELDLTAEEMERLGNAFKEKTFRDLFFEYAQELSDPENKRRYEEELKVLERNRGNTIEFIHPEPVKALRTCLNGSQKCFINICASEKVGKPSCSPKVLEDGRRAPCWALPYILHPERQDLYRKGHKVAIYDVVFHPETLDMASKNKRFQDMVHDTAIQGIQSTFGVSLDANHVKEIRAKCKGTPQTCVIRKPIPGYQKPPGQSDRLEFPYPDERRRPTSSQKTDPAGSAVTAEGRAAAGPQIQTKEAATPKYTVKYRSYVDIQDFRCSRDSAQSPRPKEIVVTIDVPLLKEVKGARVEARDRTLLLESETPAYRLELPLVYPVDEERGEAKFSRQKGQLTVTLPVLPAQEASERAPAPAPPQGHRQVEDGEEAEEREEPTDAKEERAEGQTSEGEGEQEEEAPGGVKKERDGEESRREEEACVEEESKQRQGGVRWDTDDQRGGSSGMENQPPADVAQHSGSSENGGDAALGSTLTSTSKTRTSDAPEEAENETGRLKVRDFQNLPNQNVKVPANTCLPQEEATPSSPCSVDMRVAEAYSLSQRAHESRTAEASGEGSSNEVPEEHPESPQKQEGKDNDQDDRPAEQVFHHQEPGDQPPPAVLTEIDEDGNQVVISDHSTSAGFTFQNSLLYELD